MAEGNPNDSTARVVRLSRNDAIDAIAECSADTIMVVDLDGRILFLNRTSSGYTMEQALGKSIFDFTPPEDRTTIRGALDRVISTGLPTGYSTVLRPPGRESSFWESRVSAVHDARGQVVQLVIIATDVTAQRASERERERLLALSLDIIVVATLEGHFCRVNQAFTRALDRSEEELLSKPFVELMHPDDVHVAEDALADLSQGRGVSEIEVRYLHRNGSYRLLSWTGTADPETGRIYATARDITEARAAQARQRQIQKMDAVGQLAGGIAHDFNNLLQVVLGNAEMAGAALPADGSQKKQARRLSDIEDACMRGQALVRQLLAFSRPRSERTEALDVRPLVQSVATLVRRLMPDDIEIALELTPEALVVEADRSQLEQVLMNLCVNGRDAMPRGGVLTLRALRGPGSGEVAIEVEDTGKGVPEEYRERVYEPFFTTKGPAGGSGLGLSTAYGIVRQHGGSISISTGADGGALFRVQLPASDAVPETKPAPVARRVTPRAGVALVAEDQASVREAAVETLRDAGYLVRAASDGHEALEIMNQHGAEIDVAILDVVMPRLGGPEAWERIHSRWPHMRAVFVTGFADAARLGNIAELRATLIEKPYRAADLIRAVAAAREG